MNENLIKKELTRSRYQPDLGFIGQKKVLVSNYIFRKEIKDFVPYKHTTHLAHALLKKSAKENFEKSKLLTEFIRKRGLTFSKKMKNGTSRTFAVPVTTTPVVITEDTFNTVEVAAQILVFSLRKVLQSIYGAKTIEGSDFIQSLPENIRALFCETIATSPQYLSALHHPVMKEYPFFDTVGLDLVLDQDLESTNPQFPFRLLEINAGSPSGASNNMHLIDGMLTICPEIIDSLGEPKTNDHFETLAETYKSLGATWTKQANGIAVVIPPGGSNGATPEIHQLATYSGVHYVDPTQLYRGSDGFIYLRTISGKDPIVTSIYSRVNADSALFDLERGITMRDQESGETLYLEDYFKTKREGKYPLLNDSNGKPIPVKSQYTVPEAVDALHSRKVYIGGLNRILDNKILLPILCHYAPLFYAKELGLAGLDIADHRMGPPETLPSEAASLNVIKSEPEEWVIKTPDLSGGTGVYILKCLNEKKRKEILSEVAKTPQKFTYQRLVKIARIPVAVKDAKQKRHRYANLAADIRTWVFFGAGKNFVKPKMTRNGLVRFANQERGPFSSIVNTSQGGGYAPLFVTKNSLSSIKGSEILSNKLKPVPLVIDPPVFVAAQIIQTRHIVERLNDLLSRDYVKFSELSHLSASLRVQVLEILSYLHPFAMEPVTDFITELFKIQKNAYKGKKIPYHLDEELCLKLEMIERIKEKEEVFTEAEHCLIEEFLSERSYENANAAIRSIQKLKGLSAIEKKQFSKRLTRLQEIEESKTVLSKAEKESLKTLLDRFQSLVETGLARHESKEYLKLLLEKEDKEFLSYHSIFPTLTSEATEQSKALPLVASHYEFLSKVKLADSVFVSDRIKEIRQAWFDRVKDATRSHKGKLSEAEKELLREKHFERFPELKEYQGIINAQSYTTQDMIKLLDVLPYAKYNIERFAESKKTTLEALLSRELAPNRIAVLSEFQRKKLGLASPFISGECFAKKKSNNSRFSESEVFLWVNDELPSFVKLYTIGHEIIHYHQIQEIIEKETASIQEDPFQFALFLNYFGNYLGSSTEVLDQSQEFSKVNRQSLFGFADVYFLKKKSPLVKKLAKQLAENDEKFQGLIEKYGSLLGFITPAANPIRVKAIREIIPALENAKNITFAQELGLSVGIDAAQSALPTANKEQVERFRERINKCVKKTNFDSETLRIIGSHQLYGVSLSELKLRPHLSPLYMGPSYNSVQQQQ